MTTVVTRGAGARAERLWNARGVEALCALQAGEIEIAAEVERNWS